MARALGGDWWIGLSAETGAIVAIVAIAASAVAVEIDGIAKIVATVQTVVNAQIAGSAPSTKLLPPPWSTTSS